MKFVAGVGFDPVYGARPLQRAVERHVVGPLSRWLLQHEPAKGAVLRVHLSPAGECVVGSV